MRRQRVSYVFPISHRFRARFHELLRNYLNENGVHYDYVYSDIDLTGKGDTVDIDWATKAPLTRFNIARVELLYLHFLLKTWKDDLVIIQQENRIISNYVLQIVRRIFGKKVAFFGHGRNFQASNPNSLSERFKKFWLKRVDWWFAYTARSGQIVASTGYDPNKITVFNNAIDVSSIQRQMQSLNRDAIARNAAMVESSLNVGIYIGGLYSYKRIDFLLEAVQLVRESVPDFHFVVVGGGEDAAKVAKAAATHSWIHTMGPRFGPEKSELASISRVFLMPGLVGLGVLDSFAYGTPMVTTRLDYHSPEIDYLEHGVNGVMVDDPEDPRAFAEAVVRVLRDDAWRSQLKAGGQRALQTYTVEAMAERFGKGVLEALAS